MARIPASGTIDAKPYRVLAGAGAVGIAPLPVVSGDIDYDPSSLGAAVSVGLTSGGVEFAPNTETLELDSDQMYGRHGIVVTSWSYDVSWSMDQTDIYNLSKALGYAQGSVGTTSSGVETKLSFDGGQPSPYNGVKITTEGPKDTKTTAQVTQILSLYKALVTPSGSITFARDAKTTIPVMAMCTANSSDVFGDITVSLGITKPLYE